MASLMLDNTTFSLAFALFAPIVVRRFDRLELDCHDLAGRAQAVSARPHDTGESLEFAAEFPASIALALDPSVILKSGENRRRPGHPAGLPHLMPESKSSIKVFPLKTLHTF
jgi:hypothetical protein